MLAAIAGDASADSSRVQGTVVATESRWAYGHSAIVTESIVAQEDGSTVTVHQLGGSSGGVAMRLSHGLQVLATGDEVALEVGAVATNAGRHLFSLHNILQLRHAPGADKNAGQNDFVRTATPSGAAIYWRSGCALLSLASEGSTQIAGDTEFQVIDEVLRTWERDTRNCSEFTLRNEGTIDSGVGFDGTNVIKFREDQWCRPATDKDPQECYDQAAAAITTLFFVDDSGSSRNGEILDADIELNGVQFAFSVAGATAGIQQCQADLASTLTHEVGHFLGLDHTCWIGGPRLEDDQGVMVPSCTKPNLADEITDATMYNFQSCGETKKATLEPGDIAGMCAIYPTGDHASSCEPANIQPTGCCSVAGGTREPLGRGTWVLALLGLLGTAFVMRRSRR